MQAFSTSAPPPPFPACAHLANVVQVVLVSGDGERLGPVVAACSQKMGGLVFLAMLVGCGMFGLLLNFSQFLCTLNNSALTTTVVGVMKVVTCFHQICTLVLARSSYHLPDAQRLSSPLVAQAQQYHQSCGSAESRSIWMHANLLTVTLAELFQTGQPWQ